LERRKTIDRFLNFPKFLLLLINKQKGSALETRDGNCHFFANSRGQFYLLSYWMTWIFGHFPAASYTLYELARGFSVAFGHFPAAFQYPFSNTKQLSNSLDSLSQWLSAKTCEYPSISSEG
jgi:hypothetical protein